MSEWRGALLGVDFSGCCGPVGGILQFVGSEVPAKRIDGTSIGKLQSRCIEPERACEAGGGRGREIRISQEQGWEIEKKIGNLRNLW